MLALKFLEAGRGPFSGYDWPKPSGSGAGAWVEGGAAGLCVGGVHACAPEQLAYWASGELWVVELEGELSRHPIKIAAPRGRLVRRVTRYDEGGRVEWLRDVRLHARDVVVEKLRNAGEDALAGVVAAAQPAEWAALAARERRAGSLGLLLGYLADAATFTDDRLRAVTFCAAHTALTEDGYRAERAWQSLRLAEIIEARALLG